jgi:hypothetical protein
MFQISKTILSLLLLFVALVALSGCSAPQPAGLTDEQLVSVIENVLRSLDEDDYDNFVQDFSEPMVDAFTPESFTDLRNMLQETSGNFVSLGELGLSNRQGYALYRIPCQYELETVTVTITFAIDGDKVEGLFFTSPNLVKYNQ